MSEKRDGDLTAVPVPDDQMDDLAALIAHHAVQEKMQQRHRCWCLLPTKAEAELMRKYIGNDDCPTCKAKGKHGRLVLEFYHGNIGDSTHVVCTNRPHCDFKDDITDYDAM